MLTTRKKRQVFAKPIQTLKLAATAVSFNPEVAPPAQSITWVNDAEHLADAGQDFENNQALNHARDGIRFDVLMTRLRRPDAVPSRRQLPMSVPDRDPH
jgi:hypothetical protein